MSTVLTSPQYPFDPTGVKPTNRVVGELQPLTGVGDRDYYTVVPAATPFFADSFSCSLKNLQGEIVPMVEGVDFYLTHFFSGATRATAKPIYGSLTFLNTQLRGTLILNPYQCVGGDWCVDSNQIAKILADLVHNPRTSTWEQVSGAPEIFPPTPHEWNLVDMIGQKEMLAAMNRIVDAILLRANDAFNEHLNNNSGKAHGITPETIGAVPEEGLLFRIRQALEELLVDTDSVPEGATNKYFTENRVMGARLVDYVLSTVVQNISEQDTVLSAFTKLQAQVANARKLISEKAGLDRPHFTGLGSQNLVKLVMNTNALAIDITKAEAFQVSIQSSGSIGFNIGALGDMTDRVIEFAITTVNENSATQYAIAWPANVTWVDGTPPPRTLTANARDYWYFVSEDGGVSWIGSLSNKNPR